MKKTILLLVIILTILSTACEKAPVREPSFVSTSENTSVNTSSDDDKQDEGNDNEKKNDSDAGKDSNKSVKSSVPDEYLVSLEEARAQALELEGKSYEGIQLPDYINVADAEAVSVYNSVLHTVSLDDLYTFVKETWKWEDELLASNPTIMEEETRKQVIGEDMFYSMTDGGFVFFDGLNAYRNHPFTVLETYDLQWGDEIDDSIEYELADGKTNLKDAINYVENEINSKFLQFEQGVTEYKVAHVYVGHFPSDDRLVFRFSITKGFDGLYMETSDYYDSYDTEYFIMGYQFIAYMAYCNSLDVFSSFNVTHDFFKMDSYDKVISPYYAVKRVKEEIATVGRDGYEQAGLFYCIVNRNDEYKGDHNDYMPDNEGNEHKVYIKPFWVFTNKGVSPNNRVNVHRDTAFVDALTGDVFFYSSSSGIPY